jgi:hypothetical protein
MTTTEVSNDDVRSKCEVYANVAEFLQKRFDKPLPKCMWAVICICGETDPRFFKKDVTVDLDVLDAARALIKGIKVQYKMLDAYKWERITVVYFTEGDGAKATRTIEEFSWDDVPDDVREDHLRDGTNEVEFTAFPRAA